MESIYSKIIWTELGEPEYEIHNRPYHHTKRKICKFFESKTAEEIKKFIDEELSWVDIEKEHDYYDGHFHKIKQNEDKNELVIHDNGIFTTLLHIMIELDVQPWELELMRDILKIYYDKLTE